MEQAIRNLEIDEERRNYAISDVNSETKSEAIDASKYMIDNLVRYNDSDGRKILSEKGYRAIMDTWSTIEENLRGNREYAEKVNAARSFLVSENMRVYGINHPGRKESVGASNAMINDLIKCNLEGKKFSREGYEAITVNWNKIRINATKYGNKQFEIVENYLLEEGKRLDVQKRIAHQKISTAYQGFNGKGFETPDVDADLSTPVPVYNFDLAVPEVGSVYPEAPFKPIQNEFPIRPERKGIMGKVGGLAKKLIFGRKNLVRRV